MLYVVLTIDIDRSASGAVACIRRLLYESEFSTARAVSLFDLSSFVAHPEPNARRVQATSNLLMSVVRMSEPRTFLTRHSEDFDLRHDPLDPSRCPYERSHPGYVQRRSKLAKLVGTEQFIWCVPVERGFEYYELDKPVEWTICVRPDRILGYMNVDRWSQFFQSNVTSLRGIYSDLDRGAEEGWDILVKYPLHDCVILKRVRYRVITPQRAEIIDVESF